MNWKALKTLSCPNDMKDLVVEPRGYSCSKRECEFYITKAKFDSVVKSLYTPQPRRYETTEDNLGALNNLGHEKVRGDYSSGV